MATTGYHISGSSRSDHTYDHIQISSLWYVQSIGAWFGIIDDGSAADQFGWKWDGGFPASPGDTSTNWTKDSTINPTQTDSTSCDVFYDEANDTLHIIRIGATEYYQQYTLNTGTGVWTQTVTDEDITVSINDDDGSLVVDGSARPWVTHINASGNLQVIPRSGGSWGTNVTLSSATDCVMHDTCRIVDASGNAGILCFWLETAGGLKMAYRLDSAGLTASWTSIGSVASVGTDNHLTVQAIVLGGDTGSTVIISNKDGSNNLDCATYHFDTASWSTPVNYRAGGTRPRPVVDSENEVIYFFWNDSTGSTAPRIVYDYASIQDIIDNTGSEFTGSPVTVIEDTAVSTDFLYVPCPRNHCDSTSNIVVFGDHKGDGTVWYNEVAISAAAGPGNFLSLLGVG